MKLNKGIYESVINKNIADDMNALGNSSYFHTKGNKIIKMLMEEIDIGDFDEFIISVDAILLLAMLDKRTQL